MERQRFEPTWPFLCVLMVVIILSMASPRSWRQPTSDRLSEAVLDVAATNHLEASEPEMRTADWDETTPDRSSADRPGMLTEVGRTIRPEPIEPEPTLFRLTPQRVVVPIERVAAIEPMLDFAGQAAEVDTPPLDPASPVLPSRGTSAARHSSEQPADSAWLPVPLMVGPMPLVKGASFDPAVLPVRRPAVGPRVRETETVRSSEWPEPTSLLDALEGLAWDCETGPWASEVAWRIGELGRAVNERSPETARILAELNTLGAQADEMAARLPDRRMATRLLRTVHAFGRRVDLWRRVLVPGEPLSESWQFAGSGPGQSLNAAELLRRLEQYESTGLSSDAERVAEACYQLAPAKDTHDQALSQRLQTHYRNANLRIAVTGDLLNALVPEREAEHERVRDTVLGRPVYGQSTNKSDLGVRLIPDPGRLRMALEVEGVVSAQTRSTAGPATFYNDSKSTYRAWKEMELHMQGIRVWPAKVSIGRHDTRLRSWETDLDGVPVFGALANNVARNQHNRKMPEAEREVQRKMQSRVRQQFDREAQARLKSLSETLDERFFLPLAEMSLDPVTVSAETTEERLVTRLRLATDGQLGSSTPRPEAPVDSLLSLQVHQSALNNVLKQLDLDGREFTLGELRQHVAEKLNVPRLAESSGEQDDVRIAFAEHDAAHIEIREGRVMITLAIAQLSRSPHRWSNFRVRVFYQPHTEDRAAWLVRDGVIQLMGRLDFRSQIALRGVFSKTFHKDRPWIISPESLRTDPRFQGTTITQLVIDDGWVGFALGPAGPEPKIATRPRVTDRAN